MKEVTDEELQESIKNTQWCQDLKDSLNNAPIILLEDYSTNKPYCVSFDGIDPKKKEVFRFKREKQAQNLIDCIGELVVGELIRYQAYLIEEKTNVKQSDLEKYLEL